MSTSVRKRLEHIADDRGGPRASGSLDAKTPATANASSDPVAVVLESVRELESARTAWHAAEIGAAAIAKALGARAVIIHLHNPHGRRLRIVGVGGAGASDLLGSVLRTTDDFIASTVLHCGKPVCLRFAELAGGAPRRLHVVAAARSLVTVPILASRACVGIIEVVDAEDAVIELAVVVCQLVARRLVRALSAPATTAA